MPFLSRRVSFWMELGFLVSIGLFVTTQDYEWIKFAILSVFGYAVAKVIGND